MSDTTDIQVVLRYFDVCTSGEIDVLMSTLALNVVHYFLPAIHKPTIQCSETAIERRIS